ncbi:hypothetical protein ACFSTH_05380 [Paenibacillus yanchengensis]|uniref:DUF348 domain-containing protein n=1 Tax=Paenibacillus yanchengensis TaxID=2035833 RepID=A0ABW4YHS2_9BACL
MQQNKKVSKLLFVCMSMALSVTLLFESGVVNGASNITNELELSDQSKRAPVDGEIQLPAGVTVIKVLEDVTLQHQLRKREELLSDGGKRVMITRNNGTVIVYYIEYEGLITAVNGRQVTVQVKYGPPQTITIPDQIIIEDDDQLGLKPGVQIEWEIDRFGQLISVELDD